MGVGHQGPGAGAVEPEIIPGGLYHVHKLPLFRLQKPKAAPVYSVHEREAETFCLPLSAEMQEKSQVLVRLPCDPSTLPGP